MSVQPDFANACRGGNVELVRFLMDRNSAFRCDVLDHGLTPALYAFTFGCAAIGEYLITEQGYDVNARYADRASVFSVVAANWDPNRQRDSMTKVYDTLLRLGTCHLRADRHYSVRVLLHTVGRFGAADMTSWPDVLTIWLQRGVLSAVDVAALSMAPDKDDAIALIVSSTADSGCSDFLLTPCGRCRPAACQDGTGVDSGCIVL